MQDPEWTKTGLNFIDINNRTLWAQASLVYGLPSNSSPPQHFFLQYFNPESKIFKYLKETRGRGAGGREPKGIKTETNEQKLTAAELGSYVPSTE